MTTGRFPVVTLTFWLIKYVLYQRVIFPKSSASRVPEHDGTSPSEHAHL
jgi:hypothetical protein